MRRSRTDDTNAPPTGKPKLIQVETRLLDLPRRLWIVNLHRRADSSIAVSLVGSRSCGYGSSLAETSR